GTFSGTGAYYLTNGNLSVDTGEYLGGFAPGKFVQYEGSNLVGAVSVNVDGEFDIYGGQLTATNGITDGLGDYANGASFYPYGGGAYYTLSNGVIHVDSSVAFNGGWFNQYNGQNTIVSNLVMQGRFVQAGYAYAEYLLAGGTLSVGGLTEGLAAHFSQNGGT